MTGHATQLTRIQSNADWVPVAGALTLICNAWSARRDLFVYLGRDGGQGKASAFYDPALGQIEINAGDAFGSAAPASIGDLRSRLELSKFPVAGGLAMHEAGHARFSRADWELLRKRFDSQAEWKVFELLEETRIEGRMVMAWPADRGYLRTCTRTLLMKDGPETWSPRAAAQLIVGREVVGVLEPEDAAPVVSYLSSQPGWTPEVMDRLRAIVFEVMYLEDEGADLETFIERAKELHALMPKDPNSESEPGEGEGEGEPGEGDLGDLIDAIASALSRAERDGRAEATEEAVSQEAREAREEREKDAKVQKDNQQKSATVFGSPTVPSQLRKSRAPSAEERSAAVQLSKALERARYRERVLERSPSATPPGRFNPGEAMRRQVALEQNRPIDSYMPFVQDRWQEVDETTLTVGLMSDVSGSMLRYQPGVGVAMYVISEAVYRLQDASAAAVYFGDRTYPGLRKGERLREVRTWEGGGGYEDFNGGFRALDGSLNLLQGRGARLLFVLSDGQYKTSPTDQVEARNKWTKACTENGVAVVWLSPHASPDVEPLDGLEIMTVSQNLMDTTRLMGEACIRALAKVSGL